MVVLRLREDSLVWPARIIRLYFLGGYSTHRVDTVLLSLALCQYYGISYGDHAEVDLHAQGVASVDWFVDWFVEKGSICVATELNLKVTGLFQGQIRAVAGIANGCLYVSIFTLHLFSQITFRKTFGRCGMVNAVQNYKAIIYCDL